MVLKRHKTRIRGHGKGQKSIGDASDLDDYKGIYDKKKILFVTFEVLKMIFYYSFLCRLYEDLF